MHINEWLNFYLYALYVKPVIEALGFEEIFVNDFRDDDHTWITLQLFSKCVGFILLN